jgi:maltokinase
VDDVLAFAAGGLEPEWPVALGQLTAELHRALVSSADNSTPRPTGANLRARAEAVLEQALAVTHGDAGVRLRGRAQHLRDTFARIPDDVSGPVFDIHGDLHVGQILRAPESSGASGIPRYWVLDFDGDPQLSDIERDQPDFSVRDVAHLLCSVDLVAAVVLKHLGVVSSDVRDWARRANAQLLDSYRSALAAATLGEIFDERLIDGFVAEQLLRELLYADRFLPRWQYAPDAALTFRYPSTDPEEKPWTPPAFTTT